MSAMDLNATALRTGDRVRLRADVGPILKFIYRDETGAAPMNVFSWPTGRIAGYADEFVEDYLHVVRRGERAGIPPTNS
jgi:hypothetical protein